MRILAVTYRSPIRSARGDGVRLLSLMTELALDHEIVFCFPNPSSRAIADLQLIGADVVPAERCLPRIDRRAPLQVSAFTRWRVPRSVVRAADVVHLSTSRSCGLVEPDDIPRVHVDFVDALGPNMRQRADAQRWLRPLLHREADLLDTFERRIATEARSCTAITTAEAAHLGPRVRVLANGVTRAEPTAEAPEPTICFAGNLAYFPNVEAATFLAEKVMPLTIKAVPGTRLLLVGAAPAPAIARLATLPNVTVRADVESMHPHLSEAWVVAAPVFAGTGLQTKVLEAMAHRRAVVTTPDVAGRITGVRCGHEVLCARTDLEFADAITHLLRHPEIRTRAANLGWRFVAKWSWSRRARELLSVYRGEPDPD